MIWILIMLAMQTIFSKTKIEAPDVTPRPDAKYSDKDKISFLLKQLCKTITQEKIGN